MKFLFLEWKSFGTEYILRAFGRAGFVEDIFPFPREEEDTRFGEKLTTDLAERILGGGYVFVFSLNYFPVAAIACKACRIPYLSWVYDSPFIQLYSKTIFYETNFVFVFDKGTCLDLRSKGAENVFYLPMAADVGFYDLKKANLKRYGGDVSFVGSLYDETEKYHLFRHLEKADAYTKGYLDALLQAQMGVYGQNILEAALTPEVVAGILRVCPVHAQGDGIETVEWTLAHYFLARKVAAMERRELLSRLGAVDFKRKVLLYTKNETTEMDGVENRGMVDYYDDMPSVFKSSKINLNISLRSILTGIPLRAFDIMGCGGFLLTNYQEDFLDFFVPGEDFVYYESMEDACLKVDYYLEHEEERKGMARSAYEKVKEFHTYDCRVREMLEVLG
jgi:spore maturation protein CgeB